MPPRHAIQDEFMDDNEAENPDAFDTDDDTLEMMATRALGNLEARLAFCTLALERWRFAHQRSCQTLDAAREMNQSNLRSDIVAMEEQVGHLETQVDVCVRLRDDVSCKIRAIQNKRLDDYLGFVGGDEFIAVRQLTQRRFISWVHST